LKWLMRKCVNCGRYTLRQDKCPVCGSEVRIPHPPRFSPEDRYVRYRLAMKKLVEASDERAPRRGAEE